MDSRSFARGRCCSLYVHTRRWSRGCTCLNSPPAKTAAHRGGTYLRMEISLFANPHGGKMSLRAQIQMAAMSILAALVCAVSPVADAEPYLAVQQGYKCVQCHINPTGGGLRNTFGLIFAENTLPMK